MEGHDHQGKILLIAQIGALAYQRNGPLLVLLEIARPKSKGLGIVVPVVAQLDDLEQLHKLPGSQPLATGLALAMYRWASGTSLDAVLREADMAAGDFVRWTKQTIDLLDQLSVVADGDVGRTARKALDAIRRGIVAYSSVA